MKLLKLMLLNIIITCLAASSGIAQTQNNGTLAKEIEVYAYGLSGDECSYYGANAMVGYLYKNSLFLGCGIGAEYLRYSFYGDNDIADIRIPVFISPKYIFHVSNGFSLHIQADTGFNIYTKSGSDNPQSFFVIPKVGVGFKIGESSRLNLSVGFSEDRTNDVKFTGLHMGIMF